MACPLTFGGSFLQEDAIILRYIVDFLLLNSGGNLHPGEKPNRYRNLELKPTKSRNFGHFWRSCSYKDFTVFFTLKSICICSIPFIRSMKKFLSQSNDSPVSKKVRTEEPDGSSFGTSSESVKDSTHIGDVIDLSDDKDEVEVEAEAKILPDSSHSILSSADIMQAINMANSTAWTKYGDVMYKFNPETNRTSDEMIAFDMDGTLIATKSGKKFATDENDWKLWDAGIPAKLQRLHAEGKYLAIISNQNGVKAGKVTAKAVQEKVNEVMAALNVPIDFICSTEDDRFRKPRTGMLEFLVLARCPEALRSKSLYVGDAAGRPAEGTRSKDFSDTDLKLALNLHIPVRHAALFISLCAYIDTLSECCSSSRHLRSFS